MLVIIPTWKQLIEVVKESPGGPLCSIRLEGRVWVIVGIGL